MNFTYYGGKIKIWAYTFFVAIIILLVTYYYGWRAPADFPVGTLFTVNDGKGLTQTAVQLRTAGAIRSEFWFKSFLVLFGGPKGLIAGDYALVEKADVFILASRFSRGDYELEPVKITIREGLNIFEIASILEEKIPRINREEFIDKAGNFEGYLFPDTYYFLPNSSIDTVLNVMNKNFMKTIESLSDDIKSFDKPLSDIIKMASIIEKESNKFEDSRIVSGILWSRLALGMPLQVDVSFKYINGKVTKDLSLEDLKVDSPYNSYLYKGLPPTPISNPGLNSILAAVQPIETNYLYFLSDYNGNMHYAETYKAHLQNKKLYL